MIFFAKTVPLHFFSQSVGNLGQYFVNIFAFILLSPLTKYSCTNCVTVFVYPYINPECTRTLLDQLTSKCSKDINGSFVSLTLREEHRLRCMSTACWEEFLDLRKRDKQYKLEN
jgi:hypothetical protein